MVKEKKTIFKIPYLRALKSWNEKCNPLKKKAWVLPFGPAKAKNNELYNEIVDIRKGINVECSSVPPVSKPKLPKPIPKDKEIIPVFRRAKHFAKYQRDGYKHGHKYTFTYDVKDVPADLTLPLNQVTLGSGSYASVIEGKWKNKPVAVKFQIVDASIPQPFSYRECAQEGDEDCFDMTKATFNRELKYLEQANTIGIGPKLLYHGFVDCTDVKVNPSIANPLRKPKELGLIVMEKVQGKPLYAVLQENNQKLRKDKSFKQSITQELLFYFKKLYDKYKYAWFDFHFGNIMYDTSEHKLTIIDIGDLGPSNDSWPELEAFYKAKIDYFF